jgi:murein L,D-transpeptidase YafK
MNDFFNPENELDVLLFWDQWAHGYNERAFQELYEIHRRRCENQRILRRGDSKRSKKLQKASEKQVRRSHPRFIRAVGSNFRRM